MNERIELTREEIEQIINSAVEKAVLNMKKGNVIEEKKEKKKYLKTKEFAEIFNVSRVAVHDWIIQKKIDAQRLYGTKIWRIPIEEVEKFKNRSRTMTNKDIFNRKF
ncbi:helix-turn-helix domain-containing protein [Candidatus Endomicrobiellum devescovinae]|jgi:excisionase family DNA binding protein|uniref:helix-turn-helix domain-containing protein n=1 Tax=Candidatus Endomicrobiellum devescovinae TaxID=3242322 RepID=UPI0028351EB5|nr:helix-turn-helix domain-containing protein [Endomicrobium sp.]